MRFLSMALQNFLSHSNTTINLDRRGIIGVAGNVSGSTMSNSNMAGKTALLVDSLLFALFGRTLRGYRGRDVVNWQAKKDCLVRLGGVTAGGQIFAILRPQLHSKIQKPQLILGDEVYEGDKDIEKIIHQQILGGITYESFVAAAIFGKGGMRFFTQLEDAERKKILDEILGLTPISKFLQITKSRVGFHTAQINELSVQLRENQSAYTQAQKTQQALAAQLKAFEKEKTEKKQQLGQAIIRQHNEVQKHRKVVADTKEKLRRALVHRDAALAVSTKARGKQQLAVQTQQRYETEYGAVLIKLRDIEKEIESVGRLKGKCPVCHTEVTKKHVQSVSSQLQLNIKKIWAESATLRGRVDTFKTAVATAVAAVSAAEGKLAEAVQAARTLDAEQTNALAAVELAAGRLQQLQSEEKQLVDQHSEQEAMFQKVSDEVKDLLEQSKLIAAATKLVTTDLALQNFWSEGFGNRGIKSYLMDGVIPRLNARAEYYSGILTDGELSVVFDTQTELKSGESREKLDVRVTVQGRGGVYKGCSDGTQRRADIIAALALGDLAASRVGQPIRLAILDEIFDGLDETGIDKAMQLLGHLKDERESVFVITHNDRLASYFPEIITVQYNNGISRIAT
jgi:DNA repair exonuclease SbcCD ATPase subunit